MGWWENATGDTLGDEGADVAAEQLDALSEQLLERRGRRLGLDELLGYLHLVLGTKARDLLAPGEDRAAAAPLAAELELYDEERHVRVDMAAPIDDAIRDRVDAMCARISQVYDDVLERRPTLRELLGTIRFVLGNRPDRLLDVRVESSVTAIGSEVSTAARSDGRSTGKGTAIKAGDLFAIPMPGVGFVTGHVLLNMHDADTEQRVGKASRLRERGALLLDVYGPATPEPSPDASAVLIRGIWTDAGPLEGPVSKRWKVIGARAIDPKSVEFPEWLIRSNSKARFERGEISKFVSITSEEVERIGCMEPFIALNRLARICINLVGRGDVLGEQAILFQLDGKIDLRYHPRRNEIYKLLGADPARSYWHWARARKLDPGRLWR
jgi:hypothetical protein